MFVGRTYVQFIRVYNVRRSNCCTSPQDSSARNFIIFWFVRLLFSSGGNDGILYDLHRKLFWWICKIFDREKLNSMNLLMYMAPIAVVCLIPAALIMEKNVVGITVALAREDRSIVWYLLFNSALAYFVNLTNFLVTKHTSALTLQVLLQSLCSYVLYFIASFLFLPRTTPLKTF